MAGLKEEEDVTAYKNYDDIEGKIDEKETLPIKTDNYHQLFHLAKPEHKGNATSATLMEMCKEPFSSPNAVADYVKNTCYMQINDGVLYWIKTSQGMIAVVVLDLHDKDGHSLYAIIKQNDPNYGMPYKIVRFMTGEQISVQYGVDVARLKSSRKTAIFKKTFIEPMDREYIAKHADEIVDYKRFSGDKGVIRKMPKGKKPKKKIVEHELKKIIKKKFKDGDFKAFPVVVVQSGPNIKKMHVIEFKVPITLNDGDTLCMSLRYYANEDLKWRIECLDSDAGRCDYQEQLLKGPYHKNSRAKWNKMCTCQHYVVIKEKRPQKPPQKPPRKQSQK